MKTSAFSLTSSDWREFLQQNEASPHLLSFLIDGLYKDASLWKRHLSSSLLQKLEANLDFTLPTISQKQEAEDGTVKFQLRFTDGLEVETVLIPFHKRKTICLSTQVGCAMNCSFCYTGTQGLKRNLLAGEIVGQYLVARNWLLKKEPMALQPSIVFMGQGEPLHNFYEVKKAIEVLNDSKVLGVGHRQMTLSTVGYLPGLQKVRELPKINIALSLHSPFQEERVKLIPQGQRYPLTEVMKSLDTLPLLPRQFITFEYLLIKDFNMGNEHVEELEKLLKHRKALINLIPFNPFPGSSFKRPTQDEIDGFKEKLVSRRLRVMVRTTKGDDILAACGQLKINQMARTYGK